MSLEKEHCKAYMGKKTSDGPKNIKLRCIEILNNIDFFCRNIVMDFRSHHRYLKRIKADFNQKRLISEQGVKKQAVHILQDYYSFI